MIAARFVAIELLGGCLLVIGVLGGLLGLGGVADQGQIAALAQVPRWLVTLGPLTAGLGVGLAMARMELRGERLALATAGLGPGSAVGTALGVALALGGLGFWQEGWGPRLAAPSQLSGWVGLPEGVYRLEDGLLVGAVDGRLGAVTHPESPPASLASALDRRDPGGAPWGSLVDAWGQAERRRRLGRWALTGLAGALAATGTGGSAGRWLAQGLALGIVALVGLALV